MERRTLGSTGLSITRLGFGAWAIGGGDWEFGWGDQDDAESIATIRRALECGMNWIDTAAAYGLGRSEAVVARALEDIPPSERPLVFTKCSLTWNEDRRLVHSLKPESLRRELEGSLRRLKVEAIDLYQIHWPGWPAGKVESPDLEEGWLALADLKKQGKIRHLGVSNFSVAQLERVHRLAPVESVQPPYSMLRRAIEDSVLPWCQAHNVGVIVYSPMQSGLLTGAMTRERAAALPPNDWRRNNPEFQEPRLSRNLALVEVLAAIGRRHGRTPGEVAIAWTLRHPAVTGAIVGARRPSQVDGVCGAADLHLTEDELAEIERAIPKAA